MIQIVSTPCFHNITQYILHLQHKNAVENLHGKNYVLPPTSSGLPYASDDTSYDAYLTLAVSQDDQGRNNYERVHRINTALKQDGIVTSFADNIAQSLSLQAKIANRIEKSAIVVVFVTTDYATKINSSDHRDYCQ